MRQSLPANFIVGAVLVGLVCLVAIISLVWTPHDYTVVSIADRFKPCGAVFMLGTDQFGRDELSQLMVGARNSMTVALISVGLGATLGIVLGLVAVAIGGLFEEAIMRLADFSFAFPALLLALMLASAFGPSLSIAVLAIAFINIPVFTRLSRASAAQIWRRDYVLAARAGARSTLRITLEHIVPNILPALIVQATIDFAGAILTEAALSYLGLGVQPPDPSWGRMLADAQTLLFMAPQLAIFPGLCILITVVGFNLLGDGLNDLTNPRILQRRR